MTFGSATTIAPSLVLARELRAEGIRCEVDTRGTSLKSQLRRANVLGARIVFIVGEGEMADAVVQVKDLEARTQERVAREHVVRVAADRLIATAPSIGTKETG